MIKEVINLKKVISSNIIAIGYNNEKQQLYIMFSANSLYKYFPVKKEIYENLEKSESKGSFLHKHIKYNAAYKCEKIDLTKVEIKEIK